MHLSDCSSKETTTEVAALSRMELSVKVGGISREVVSRPRLIPASNAARRSKRGAGRYPAISTS